MIKKIGKIVIGIIIGIIFVGTVWYIIQGWTEVPEVEEGIPVIQEDLLSHPAIDTARSKASVIDFPIQAPEKDMGVAKPFN